MAGAAGLGALPAARAGRRTLFRSLLIRAVPLAFFAVLAALGPLLVPYDHITVRTADRLKPPGSVLTDGSVAWLGTDQVGRDLLPQVLQGARISVLVAAATVLLAGLIGLGCGLLAGFYGGLPDTLLMRLADIQLGFPPILLAILFAAVLGPSVGNVVLTLTLARWVTFARVARATTLTAKEREFVLAARALGASDPHIVVRHILPAALGPLLVIAAAEVGLVILAEASLSFLGLGTPPDRPSWGLIIANGRAYLNTAWWISTIPGLVLSLLVIAVGAFGDRLRDCFDPRLIPR
jgi:peptide/nickel transport system permease protein